MSLIIARIKHYLCEKEINVDAVFFRYLVVVGLLISSVIFYQGGRIWLAGEKTSENTLILINEETTEDSQIEASFKNNGFRVQNARHVKLIDDKVVRELKGGDFLKGGEFLIMGKYLYRFEIEREREEWTSIFEQSLSFIDSPLTIGRDTNDKILIDEQSSSGKYLVITPFKGRNFQPGERLFMLSTSLPKLKLRRGFKTFDLNRGKRIVGFSGDIVEGYKFGFKISIKSKVGNNNQVNNSILNIYSLDRTDIENAYNGKLIRIGYFLEHSSSMDIKKALKNMGWNDSCLEISFKSREEGLAVLSSCNNVIMQNSSDVFTLGQGRVVKIKEDSDFISGSNILRVTVLDNKGYLIIPVNKKSDIIYTIPAASKVVIAGKNHLMRNIRGTYIPDKIYNKNLQEALRGGISRINNAGFISDMNNASLSSETQNFASIYNKKVRAPVGLLIDGYVHYFDESDNLREIRIGADAGWKTSKEPNASLENDEFDNKRWRDAVTSWQWHPPVNRYTDTAFSGIKWLWYPESWHPETLSPGEEVERYFKLAVNIPGRLKDSSIRIVADSRYTLYVNGNQLRTNGRNNCVGIDNTYSSSKCFGGIEKISLPLKTGDNILVMKVTKKIPAKCDEGFYLPFEKNICEESEKRLAEQNQYNSIFNSQGKVDGKRGNIIDRDGLSIPRLIVEKGNFIFPQGTEILLDNTHPSIKAEINNTVKQIMFARKGDHLLVYKDSNIQISYNTGSNIAVAGRGLTIFRGEPPTGGRIVSRISLDYDRDAVVWNNNANWLVYNSYEGKLKMGDIIIIDNTTGKVHQVDLKINSNEFLQQLHCKTCLISKVSVTPEGGIAVKISGSGFNILKNKGEKKGGQDSLQNGDIIDIPSVGIRMRYEEGSGILAGSRKINGNMQRVYPKNTGLLPTVGYASSGLKFGVEDVFSSVLEGKVDSKRKDVRLTIDDDIQRMAQMELERGFHIAKNESKPKNGSSTGDEEKFFEGAFILLDGNTGEILASATYPVAEYDKEQIIDAIEFDKVNGSKSSIVNRGWKLIADRYHPGSTFKIITAVAAVETTESSNNLDYKNPILSMLNGNPPRGYKQGIQGLNLDIVIPTANMACQDINYTSNKPENDRSSGHPEADTGSNIENAIKESYNTYFAYLSLLLYKPLRDCRDEKYPGFTTDEVSSKEYPLLHYANLFGYNKSLNLIPKNIELHEAINPQLHRVFSDVLYTQKSNFPYYLPSMGLVAQSGIGQAKITATPIQQAMVSGLIAGNGSLPLPYLVKEVAGVEGKRTEQERIALNAHQKWLNRIKKGMKLVVKEGTAERAFADSQLKDRTYAKTGTSQRGEEDEIMKNDSWFIGFIEPDQIVPESKDISKHVLAFACLMADAGYGGKHAGDTSERILRRLSRYFNWRD